MNCRVLFTSEMDCIKIKTELLRGSVHEIYRYSFIGEGYKFSKSIL